MKICIVASGTFDHVQPYIDHFKNNGHEVFFVALSPTPNRGAKIIKCWIGENKIEGSKPKKWKYLISALIARSHIKKIKPDIVHAHFATSGGLAAWIACHRNTIITVHGTDVNSGVQSKLWKELLKIFFNFAKIVHVVSKDLEAKVTGLGIPANKIVNLNVGIDTKIFKRVKSTNNSKDKILKILCNRSFKKVYDHFTLLKALILLKQKEIPFNVTLIGNGCLKNELEDFVTQNNLESSVHFLGKVSYEDQIKHFHDNDLYVSTSLSDGTSLSLLEAMASGLYPVVTNILANQDWIKHEDNGLMFPVGDYQTLSNLLEKSYGDRSNFINASSKNWLIVNEFGDRRKNMIAMERLYKKLSNDQ